MLRQLTLALALFTVTACNCGNPGPGDGGTGGGTAMSNPPAAAFTVAAAPYTAGTAIAFDGSGSTDPDGDALTYSWDFGDGRRGGGAKIVHTFGAAGSFTVKLTVADPSGAMGSTTQALTVVAGPQPPGQASVRLTVKAVSGALLSGVTLKLVGTSTTAMSDVMGVATLMIGTQVRQAVEITKAGYADKLLVFTIPDTLTQADQIVYLAPRGAAQMVDATAGGTLTGADGVMLQLPPSALVTNTGAPVTGMVSVSLTPLDVVHDTPAFPGRFEGQRTDGAEGLLLSYGTAELVLTQGANRVQLAPGKTASLELPLYADRQPGGAALTPGMAVPLWSLDEQTGAWIEEGQGTVVVSSAVPSGLAFRASVGHFSWWNCDAFSAPPSKPKPKCCIDGDADGMCDANGNPEYCWVRGTTNCASAFGCKVINALPAYDAEAVIPGVGGIALPIPANTDLYFLGVSPNNTHRGQLTYRGLPNASDEPVILLTPFDAGNATVFPVTVPSSTDETLQTPVDFDIFEVDALVGEQVHIEVSRPANSNGLEGNYTVTGPDGFRADNILFGIGGTNGSVGQFAFKAHVAGKWRITVRPTRYTPSLYTLKLARAGRSPYIDTMSPTFDTGGLPTSTVPVLTMSGAVQWPVSTNAGLEFSNVAVPNSTVVIDGGPTLTYQPGAALFPGTLYRYSIRPALFARPDDGGVFFDYGGTVRIPFRTAEVMGQPALCGTSPGTEFAATTDRGVKSSIWYDGNSGITTAVYQPGAGWLDTAVLRSGRMGRPSVAANGEQAAMAFAQVRVIGQSSDYQLWITRLSDAGWSPPVPLTIDGGQIDPGTQSLALEANGRTTLAWRGSTVDFWAMQGTPAGGFGPARLLYTADIAAASGAIQVASNNGRDLVLYTAFQTDAGGGPTTHAARYDGTAWGPDVVVPVGGSIVGLTSAVDGEGNMLALWHEGAMYAGSIYQPDAGWSGRTTVHPANYQSFCTEQPALAIGRAHGFLIAGCEPLPQKGIFTRTWDPTTATWSAPTTLSTAGVAANQFAFSRPAGETAVMWWRDLNMSLQWRLLQNGTWSAQSALPAAPINTVVVDQSSSGKAFFYWPVNAGVSTWSGVVTVN